VEVKKPPPVKKVKKVTKVSTRPVVTENEEPELAVEEEQEEVVEEEEEVTKEEKPEEPVRDRRKAMAVNRGRSKRSLDTISHSSTASFRRQLSVKSKSKIPAENLDVASEAELTPIIKESDRENDENADSQADENNSKEQSESSTKVGESEILSEVTERRAARSKARQHSVAVVDRRRKGSVNVSRQTRRASMAKTPEPEPELDENIIQLIDPQLLMNLNHRESFFGVPDEKHVQSQQALKRRRSIPRDFIYYEPIVEIKPLPSSEPVKLESAEAGKDSTSSLASNDEKKKKLLDEKFSLHTKNILQNTKGRIEDIKNMLAANNNNENNSNSNMNKDKDITPPPSARGKELSKKKLNKNKKSKSKEEKEKNNTSLNEINEETEKKEAGANSKLESSSSTAITPPPSAAASNEKGKAGAGGRVTKVVVPPVELLPPPENATKFELSLRNALITIVRNTKGMNENFTHTVINGLNDFIHRFSSILYDSFDGLWNALSSNKISLDFFEKLSTVFNGIISLAPLETTTIQLADVCATLVPLAGSTHNAALTHSWQEKIQIPEDVLVSLLPSVVNYETGERRNRSLFEYLEEKITIYPYDPKLATALISGNSNAIKTSENPHLKDGIDETIFLYFPKLLQMNSSMMKMKDHTNELNSHLTEDLVEVLREWSTAKSVFLELEKRLETEREKTKKPLEMKLNTISKELTKVTALYEKSIETIRNQETKIKEYEKYEVELKKCELKLVTTQHQLDELVVQHSQLKVKHSDLIDEHTASKHILIEKDDDIRRLNSDVSENLDKIASLEKIIKDLKEALANMTYERNTLRDERDALLEKEDRRLNKIISVSMQTEPELAEIGLQTEFFMPPVSSLSCFCFFSTYLFRFSLFLN
jgi:hypothetical protein